MDKHYELYSTLEQFKKGSGSEYTALCPYHPDTKASFSCNPEKRQHYCFACGERGNTYTLAQHLGHHNPKEYLTNMNGASTYTPKKIVKKKEVKILKPDELDNFESYKNRLRVNWDKFKYNKIWKKELIDELGIGIDADGILWFAQHDINGKIIAIQKHKSIHLGDGSSKWYLKHKISSYSKDKPLLISEGIKDAITLYSDDKQVISNTTGCNNFPVDDLEILKGWNNDVFIPYDNDSYGYGGAKKLAQELLKIDANLKIFISRWKNVPDAFDVTDSFMKDDGEDFEESIRVGPEELYIPKKIGGFELIKGTQVDNEKVEDVVQIIEALLPEMHNTLLSGTTGSNKSMFAMNMGMSLANNEKTFLKFNINKKNLKILYVDTEVGKTTMLRRCQKIKASMNWKSDSDDRWNMISKKGMLEDVLPTIRSYIELLKPDIVIIDCLYNITDGADTSKNHHLSPILNKIDGLKDDFNITIMLISHFNKGNHKEGLTIDRINGASALQNWLEHCILITKTNEKSIRLMKIDKTRDIDYPSGHFKLEFNPPTLINRGVIDDWGKYLVTEQKATKWNDVLIHMPLDFTNAEFTEKCMDLVSVSDKTARNWLKDMVMHKIITKLKQGHYRQDESSVEDNVFD